MAANYWIKLYHEILDDPKMATLPDRLWRRAIELFLCAGRFGKTGDIPETMQLAWVLRLNTDELEMDLKQLASTGIIQRTKTGWLITNFATRQAPTTVAERQRYHREYVKKQQYNENVTNESQSVTQINRLTDNRLTDTEREEESSPASSSGLFSSQFQDHAPMDAERLYRQVTGQVSIPSAIADEVIANLTAVRDSYQASGAGPGVGYNEKMAEEGRGVFARWCSTTGKNKRPYSRTNPGWITWWLEELAPSPRRVQTKPVAEMTREEFHEYVMSLPPQEGSQDNV